MSDVSSCVYIYVYICISIFLWCLALCVRAKTMKLNKGKLRRFAQSGEIVAAPVFEVEEGGREAFEAC